MTVGITTSFLQGLTQCYTTSYDLFSVYKDTSVFVANIRINAVVPDAMEQAICHGNIKKSDLYD